MFAHRSVYAEKPLHKGAFTDKGVYTQKLLHTHTQRRCCTKKSFHIQLEHTEAFTDRNFYTKKSLHREPLHTEAFTHTEVFTQRSLYTEKLLHAEAFAHRSFYTEKPLQKGAFTDKGVYVQKLSSHSWNTMRIFWWHWDLLRPRINKIPGMSHVEPQLPEDFIGVLRGPENFLRT